MPEHQVGLWEIVVIGALVVIGAGLRLGLELSRRSGSPQHHAGTRWGWAEALTVWLAQGFGVGRVPLAPGTLGSGVGLLWLAVLVNSRSVGFFLGALLLGLLVAVGVCGDAARILRQADPPSVVLDEIAAMPICFAPWVAVFWFRHHAMPSAITFFQGPAWVYTLTLFAAFRLFDVVKPWPIRQSQRLPGGLGIVADDLLAALYVAVAVAVALMLGSVRSRIGVFFGGSSG